MCTDILERIKNKAGRSFRRTFPPGRLFWLPCRPAGCDSVMDYHAAINLSAHLVCSYCYAGINKQTSHKCPVSTITRGAESDGAECLYTPGTRRCKPSLATSHTINPTRNGFSVNAGKQVLHKTAVFLIQQKGPVQTLAAVQIVTADTACFVPLGFFFPPSLSSLLHSLKYITSLPPYPLNQCNAACKAGKNRAYSAFSPFQDNAVACIVMWEGRVTYCLLLQAHPCSQEEALPSKAARQSSPVSAAASFETNVEVFHLAHIPFL